MRRKSTQPNPVGFSTHRKLIARREKSRNLDVSLQPRHALFCSAADTTNHDHHFHTHSEQRAPCCLVFVVACGSYKVLFVFKVYKGGAVSKSPELLSLFN